MKVDKIHQPHRVLSRGLGILSYLMLYPSGCRYGEIKVRFNIGDASLTRVLKSLLALHWLKLSDKGTYILGEQSETLLMDLKVHPEKNELQELVTRIAIRAKQSCAFCSLDGDKMIFKASKNIPNSIVTMPISSTLNPECDHAGALAILSLCKKTIRSEFYLHDKGTIKNESHFQRSLKKFTKSRVILDLSNSRKRVSRMAIAFMWNDKPSALFLCGLSTELRQQYHRLNIILEEGLEITGSKGFIG